MLHLLLSDCFFIFFLSQQNPKCIFSLFCSLWLSYYRWNFSFTVIRSLSLQGKFDENFRFQMKFDRFDFSLTDLPPSQIDRLCSYISRFVNVFILTSILFAFFSSSSAYRIQKMFKRKRNQLIQQNHRKKNDSKSWRKFVFFLWQKAKTVDAVPRHESIFINKS